MRTSTMPETTLLLLDAATAADLMTDQPVSVNQNAILREALTLLLDKGFHAAPVINEAGHPVGVLSRSDLLEHDRESVDHLHVVPEFYRENELATSEGETLNEGFEVERFDAVRVRDVMTPAVFSVTPMTPAGKVINDLVSLHVHRLFVVDDQGVLVGVISTSDVLKRLRLTEERD